METTPICGFKSEMGRFYDTKQEAIKANYVDFLYKKISDRHGALLPSKYYPPTLSQTITYMLDNPGYTQDYLKEIEESNKTTEVKSIKKETKWWEIWKNS